jgi:parvulin-like peptidyl-prolyl isomerase
MPHRPADRRQILYLLALPFLALLTTHDPARADSPGPGTVVNRVVLRVNERIATLYDYQTRVADRLAGLAQAQLPEERQQQLLASAPQDALKEMFEEMLILSRADQLSIQISEVDLDRAVDDTKERAGIKEQAAFERALADAGMTLQDLRDRLRKNQIFQEVMGREVQSRVKVEDDALQRYYHEHLADFAVPEQLKLREVVVLEEGTPDRAARGQLAAEIGRRLAAGETLEALVGEYAPKKTVSDISDLGFVTSSDLDGALYAAVHGVEVGAFSTPVEGRGGIHILQLLGRREATTRPFTDVEQEIRGRERARIYERELAAYMKELETRSFIQADPPPEAADFRASTGAAVPDELSRAIAESEHSAEGATADPAAAPPAEPAPPPKP